MNRMLPLFIGLCLILASPVVLAQEKRFEVNGVVGYTLSSGVDVADQEVDDVIYNRVSPKSGFSYDVGFDVFVSEGWSLGFNYGRQDSALRGRARTGPDRDFTDMAVNNYHGTFTYNFGDEDEPLRPYIFGGLGATQYSPSDIDGQSVSGRTKFSSTWGGGVKYFASDNFGFKGGVRWTPTYITTTPGGMWCSWYYCWHVGNDHFGHQFELSGGIVARF